MVRYRATCLLALAILLIGGSVRAQEVGTVAAAEGSGDIGRGGNWQAAKVGDPVQQGDELRTGHPGRLRIVFQDDSVLTVTDDSHLTIDEQVFDPSRGTARSLVGLLQGKVSALVSDYYHRAGSNYEIKTATAVAGVRGTEFTMAYDPRNELTEVVGISGHVEVHSATDPSAPGVLVTARESTEIARGRGPTTPRQLEDRLFRQQMEGIEFIRIGRGETLSLDHPLSTGVSVPQPDKAQAMTGTTVPHTAPTGDMGDKRDAGSLVGKSPSVLRAMKGQLGIEF